KRFSAMANRTQTSVRHGGTGSVAAIKGHPLHPALVPITIGMYVAAACADVAFARTGDPFWALGTRWLLLGTLVSGAAAALPGMIDFAAIDRAHKLHAAWAHAVGNLIFLGITAVNYSWRQANVELGSSGLILTLVGLVLMFVTGWLGGEMSYCHGIGVSKKLDRSDED
ncbi:DUF2231 domain-containing protein, partial [Lichenifustis flavocetrariae]